MARPPRLDVPGYPQHAVVRGHNRAPIFHTELDRKVFLKYLKQGLEKASCELHAYVLMTNHVHLLVTGKETGALSRMMHSVARRYSLYCNKSLKRSGSLFEGRFHSSLVQTGTYFLACMRYIERNPVRAGMVQRPAAYPWSSHSENVTGHPRGLLTAHAAYIALGDADRSRALAYRALFDLPPSTHELESFRRRIRKDEPVGDEVFTAMLSQIAGRPVLRPDRGRPMKTKRDGAEINLVPFPGG